MTREHDGTIRPMHESDPGPRRLLMNARPAGMALPPWVPDDPEAVVATLLEEAHRDLPADALAEVLVATRSAIRPLHSGRGATLPASGPASASGRWSPTAWDYVRPVRAALALGARAGGPEGAGRIIELAGRIERQIEAVASRPRGPAAPR